MPFGPDELFTVEPLRHGRPSPDQWAADPAPIEGELFTSWFSRVAGASAIGPQALYRTLRRFLDRPDDLDLLPHPRLIAHLSQRTGHDIARLERLQRFAHAPGWAWKEFVGPPRFCPRCWREDPVPHVPWPWRITPMAICSRHGRWLRDRCPKCGALFSPLAGVKRRPIWHCHGCGRDLRSGDGGRASPSLARGQTIIMDLADLAEELDRPALLFDVMAGLRDLGFPGRNIRQEMAHLGNSMELAHKLLDGVTQGPVRQHLLRVLRAGSLDDANKVEPLPTRCWRSFNAAMKPVIRTRPDLSAVSLFTLIEAYDRTLSRLPAPAMALVGTGLRSRRPGIPDAWGDLEVRFATIDDAYGIAELIDRRSTTHSNSATWIGYVRTLLTTSRCSAQVGVARDRIVALALFTDQILTILLTDAEFEDRVVPFLEQVQSAVRIHVVERGHTRLKAGVTPQYAARFEAAGWQRAEPPMYDFACDAFMNKHNGKAVRMILEFMARPLP